MLSCVSWQCFRSVPQLLNLGGCLAEGSLKLFLPLKMEEKELSSEFTGLHSENSKGFGNWLKLLVLIWLICPWIFTLVRPIQRSQPYLCWFPVLDQMTNEIQSFASFKKKKKYIYISLLWPEFMFCVYVNWHNWKDILISIVLQSGIALLVGNL